MFHLSNNLFRFHIWTQAHWHPKFLRTVLWRWLGLTMATMHFKEKPLRKGTVLNTMELRPIQLNWSIVTGTPQCPLARVRFDLKVSMFAFLFQAFFSLVAFNLIVFRLVGRSVLFFLSLFICYVFPFLETRLIDMELHYPFLYFSLDDILLLISCILTQQRIVFLSSSYSLLTPIIEVCIVSYMWILFCYLHNLF